MKSNKNNAKSKRKTKKEPYIPGLYDKPAIEKREQGIPLSMELCPDMDKDELVLVDREHYGRAYTVEKGIYTIRLGIHSSSLSVAAMDEEAAVACVIPTVPDNIQKIMGLFFIPELYPVKYMDVVWLQAEKPFRIEYMFGTAMLESNNDSRGLALRHDAVTEDGDMLIIMQNGLDGEIPAFCSFTYDFIKFQIKVIFEE